MKSLNRKFIALFGGACLVIVIFVVSLIFLSERFAAAENDYIQPPIKINGSSQSDEIYVTSFEKQRLAYLNVKTVDLESDVTIDIYDYNSGKVIKGKGKIKYVAQDDKYRYVCEISENLVEQAGLMRNVDILYTGNKFYFYDHESKIVSSQKKEEQRHPSSMPNPFFLPIEFFSSDNDECKNCKMRLKDLKVLPEWSNRVNSISDITPILSSGGIYNSIKISGGKLDNIPYNYLIKFIGKSEETILPKSIARVREDGGKLFEIILNDHQDVDGIDVEIPYSILITSYDEKGRVNLTADFSTTKLKINQKLESDLLSPKFDGAEKFYDSDAKTFVKQ